MRRRTETLHPNRAARRRAQKLASQAPTDSSAKGSGSALAALTTGVLALPGMAGSAAADSAVDRIGADYAYSFYEEDNIRPSLAVPGSDRERYTVHMHQLKLSSPVPKFENVDVGLDVVYESMSGASPWWVEPDASSGDPLQVMSGATIEDARTDVLIAVNRYLEDGRISLAGGVSVENDYLAGNIGFDFEKHTKDKNTTFFGGFAASIDTIEPTDWEEFDRIKKAEKQTYSMVVGFSQIIDPASLFQFSLSYRHGTGYLTDPYKRVWIANSTEREKRPDKRNQVTLEGRYRRHFESIAGTLHADYSFFVDDWSMIAHTFNLAWYQTFFEHFQIIPTFRYYSQSGADFYAAYFPVRPRSDEVSSDYRLSPFGAFFYGLRGQVNYSWKDVDLRFFLSANRYLSSADYALGDVTLASPGLVNFYLFSGGIGGTF